MSRATRAAAELVKINARIAEIEAVYPDILASKAGGKGSNTYSNQDFRQVADEYQRLLNRADSLQELIEADAGNESASVAVAFRTVAGD
jgi:hypothetical protein